MDTSKLITIVLASLFAQVVCSKEPDIETYGKLPEYRSVSISPDGEHYAYIQQKDDTDMFIVRDARKGKPLM